MRPLILLTHDCYKLVKWPPYVFFNTIGGIYLSNLLFRLFDLRQIIINIQIIIIWWKFFFVRLKFWIFVKIGCRGTSIPFWIRIFHVLKYHPFQLLLWKDITVGREERLLRIAWMIGSLHLLWHVRHRLIGRGCNWRNWVSCHLRNWLNTPSCLAKWNPVTLKGFLELSDCRYYIQPLIIVHYTTDTGSQHFKGKVNLGLRHSHIKIIPGNSLSFGIPKILINMQIGGQSNTIATITDCHHNEQVPLLGLHFTTHFVCSLTRHQPESDWFLNLHHFNLFKS